MMTMMMTSYLIVKLKEANKGWVLVDEPLSVESLRHQLRQLVKVDVPIVSRVLIEQRLGVVC